MASLATLSILDRDDAPAQAPAPRITPEQRAALTHLRMSAMACRVAARTDLYEACALLSLDGEDAKRTFVDTLIKCLPNAVQRKVVWFAPGTDTLSFDEAWILRCLTSIRENDPASLNFLIKSRVSPADRRYIGYLLGQISEQFSQV